MVSLVSPMVSPSSEVASQGAGAKAPQALEGAEFERKHGHVQGKNRCYDCYYFAIAYSHCYCCCYYIIIIN